MSYELVYTSIHSSIIIYSIGLKCKALCIERKMYIQEIYINKPSIAVMHKLLNSCDVKILSNMVKFVTIINAKFA